jgi:hypothetical protein
VPWAERLSFAGIEKRGTDTRVSHCPILTYIKSLGFVQSLRTVRNVEIVHHVFLFACITGTKCSTAADGHDRVVVSYSVHLRESWHSHRFHAVYDDFLLYSNRTLWYMTYWPEWWGWFERCDAKQCSCHETKREKKYESREHECWQYHEIFFLVSNKNLFYFTLLLVFREIPFTNWNYQDYYYCYKRTPEWFHILENKTKLCTWQLNLDGSKRGFPGSSSQMQFVLPHSATSSSWNRQEIQYILYTEEKVGIRIRQGKWKLWRKLDEKSQQVMYSIGSINQTRGGLLLWSTEWTKCREKSAPRRRFWDHEQKMDGMDSYRRFVSLSEHTQFSTWKDKKLASQ